MGDQTDANDEVSLSESDAEWLRERATDLETSEEDLLGELLAAFRAIEAGEKGVDVATTEDLEALRERVEAVESLQERVESLDAEFEEALTDVRERVVQVKRETDQKAPEDHDHPSVERNVDAALRAAHAAEADLGDLEEYVESGFSNYEDVLEYLTDETDELHGKVGTLARVTLDLRDAIEHLAAREERRSATERLALRANELGVRRATCEECGETVDVALLAAPACPSCESTFTDVEPKRGFLGSPTLVVGDRPALEAPTVDDLDTDALADLADGDADAGRARPDGEDLFGTGTAEPPTEERADEPPEAANGAESEPAETQAAEDPAAEDPATDDAAAAPAGGEDEREGTETPPARTETTDGSRVEASED